jgi:two-component system, cell cycle response regulator
LTEAREALREKATHDPLTGLWNHEEIIRILEVQLSRAEREGGCVSVIMGDLDKFKMINDRYGHMAGDTVLRITSQRILKQIRDYDYAGRYGGEEFLIVMPGCKRKDAPANAERIRLSIAREGIDICDDIVTVTMSLGTATNIAGRACSHESLIQAADMALYLAKEKGRNRVEVAHDDDI